MNEIFAFALAIGFVAGLRSMIAPAMIAWAAHRGWLTLGHTSLNWMGSTPAVAIFSLLALGELLGDKLPFAPKRTTPFPISARIVLGGFCGMCLFAAAHQSYFAGAALGVLGGVAGAFAGYRVRRWLVRNLHTCDLVIAIAEDLIALGIAIFVVSARLLS
jgi:uncharacterized membrane protein